MEISCYPHLTISPLCIEPCSLRLSNMSERKFSINTVAVMVVNGLESPAILWTEPGRNGGLWSTTRISRGTILFEERPALILPRNCDPNAIMQALLCLEPPIDNTLYNRHPHPVPSQWGIYDTHAMPCGSHLEARCLCTKASRFRSSCSPNVQFAWIESKAAMRFWTLRQIEASEELFVSYDVGGLLKTREERIRRGCDKFGDHRGCIPCRQATYASDRERAWLGSVILPPPNTDSLMDSIALVSSNLPNYTRSKQTLQVKRALDGLRSEDLHFYRDTLLYDGFTLCARSNDRNNAMGWLAMAKQAAITSAANGDARDRLKLNDMTIWEANPDRYPNWGKGPQTMVEGPPLNPLD